MFIRRSEPQTQTVKHIDAHCTNTGCTMTEMFELVFVHFFNPGLRKGDVIRLGPAQRQNDRFYLRHTKNNSDTILPVAPDVDRTISSLDPALLGNDTYLITEFGKPFTPAGFGNWFRARCDLADLKNCSAHGLRKALSRRIAEAGGTANQGRAVTGHRTDRMFAYYSQSADKAALANTVLANVSEKFAKLSKQPQDK